MSSNTLSYGRKVRTFCMFFSALLLSVQPKTKTATNTAFSSTRNYAKACGWELNSLPPQADLNRSVLVNLEKWRSFYFFAVVCQIANVTLPAPRLPSWKIPAMPCYFMHFNRRLFGFVNSIEVLRYYFA